MPEVDSTELAVLKAVTRLGVKAHLLELAREVGISLALTIDVRDYLMRQGYLVEIDRRYMLTDEGTQALYREQEDTTPSKQ